MNLLGAFWRLMAWIGQIKFRRPLDRRRKGLVRPVHTEDARNAKFASKIVSKIITALTQHRDCVSDAMARDRVTNKVAFRKPKRSRKNV